MSNTSSSNDLNTHPSPKKKKDPTPHQISLTDRSLPQDLSSTSHSDAEQSDSEALTSINISSEPLVRQATSASLRENLQQRINKQKFARYQSSRYNHDIQELGTTGEQADNVGTTPRGVFERGRARAAGLLSRKKNVGRGEDRDAVLDILYENQRGSFLFGIPRYSSNSLLQFDPKPWQNADFRTSAVDIRNAQVPDPSWQWAWKSWYVDMSRDVDEEGWEYSFAFPAQFAWHGNHPWFHSFVRRRRWLRRRVRKDTVHKTKEKAHELAPDYFTIHTKVLSAGSQSERTKWNPLHLPEEEPIDDLEVPDILSLVRYMGRARIDREKLMAIRKFISQGGEDLHYLAGRMSEIMSLFIYQSSRRQLLAELIQHHEAVTKQRLDLAAHDHKDDEKASTTHDTELRKAQSLSNAIAAADTQVQKLEYWSDIKDIAQLEPAEAREVTWDKKRWQGVGEHNANTFRAKQSADAPAAALNNEPEKQSKHIQESSRDTDTSGYTTAPSESASAKHKPQESLAKSTELPEDDTDNGLERFVTASEGPVSSIKPKQWRDKRSRRNERQPALQLDGVEEDHDEGVIAASSSLTRLAQVDAESAIVVDK